MTTAEKLNALERKVETTARSYALLAARTWMENPEATVLASARATLALAVRLAKERPEKRALVLQWMKRIQAAFEAETSATRLH